VEADGTVREERAPELVVERADQTGLSPGLAHVAEFFGSAEEPQALKGTLLFEGHRFLSQVGVSVQQLGRGEPMVLIPLNSKVSRPFRHSSD
jgi:hypothetical protein